MVTYLDIVKSVKESPNEKINVRYKRHREIENNTTDHCLPVDISILIQSAGVFALVLPMD